MTWIKFESTTHDKQEVWQMASTLRIEPDAVVGKLLRVWVWFDMQTKDGNASSVTKSLLDNRVNVTGFCDSMISVGWMTEKDGVISLPNFERHNGQTAKNRALGAVRTQKSRKRNAETVTETSPEKRREDKSITHTHTGGGIAKEKVDPKLLPHWEKWCSWLETITGRKVDPIRAETMLMDMERRGIEKSIRDIDFSILKDAKALLDSENDFQKQMASPRQNGPPKKPKKTVHEMMEEIYGPRDQWDKEDEQK